MAEGMAQQFSIPAIQQMAKIQDLRGPLFALNFRFALLLVRPRMGIRRYPIREFR